jgi:2-octaprenyl-6-methoxyphenol hydroxylase
MIAANRDFDLFDLIIAGGGLVGASLACALGGRGLRIGILEAHPFGSRNQPSYDDRSIALSYGSKRIFSAMGIWSTLTNDASPIRHIHISNRGQFGFTRLHSDEAHTHALGYVIENRVLGQALAARLQQLPDVQVISPARVVDLNNEGEFATVTAETAQGPEQFTARLLVAADGHDSSVRQLLNVGVRETQYEQSAIIANVTPEKFHNDVAYERFTDTGPLALLPLTEQRCSLVWTVRPAQVEAMMAWSDEEFAAHLYDRFGARLGRFVKIGKRAQYRLSLLEAQQHIKPRVALIGNAAHTLHPVAGQGFNLGLRDVAALAQVIHEAMHNKQDIGAMTVLENYLRCRAADHARVVAFTDFLARVFTQPWTPVARARNAALLLVDFLPPAKRALLRQSMGLAGKLPRLARGLALD